MSKLESPSQYGDKGNKGASSASAPGGKLQSPAGSTNSKEANGHK